MTSPVWAQEIFDFGGSSDDFGSDTSNQEPSDDKENNKEDDLGL